MPVPMDHQAPIPPPAYHRRQAKQGKALHIDALTLVTTLHLLTLCRLAVRLAHHRCPPPLPQGPGGAPRRYGEESLLLVALLKTLWRLSYQDMTDWLRAWPALALACGFSYDQQGRRLHVPSAQTTMQTSSSRRCSGFRKPVSGECAHRSALPSDSGTRPDHRQCPHSRNRAKPILMPLMGTLLLIIRVHTSRGFRVHTLICRGSGLPLQFLVSPANVHDAPFARPLLEISVRLYRIHPRVIRLDAAYWGLRLIHWIHETLGSVAVIPWNPKRQKNRSCLPPTWTKEELGKRSAIERFFGRVFLFFRLQRPPLTGWSAVVTQVALTYTATLIVALAAWHAQRPDLIRSPKRVLAHLWEDSQL